MKQATVKALRVLVVESNAVIGMDLADQLEEEGYTVAGPFACAVAAEWLQSNSPDLAILDLDLQAGRCVDLARTLRERAVPMLVFTAHDRRLAVPEFRNLPWLPMPAPSEAFSAAVRSMAPVA
jgi:DNA-binding response OmpR family regulator